MKHVIIAFLFSFYFLNSYAEVIGKQLIIWNKDGSKVAYSLGENPKITFTETEIEIENSDVLVFYPLENLLRFTYEKDESSSVKDISSDHIYFKYNKESLQFFGLKEYSTISICTLNGMLIHKTRISKSGDYSYPLSHLNSGVYIIKINELSYKISVK